ncbi:MAG: hypothetical protein WBF88_17630 [Pusillimonas sp.]
MFNAKRTIFDGALIAWYAVCIAALIGWVMNIVKIFQIPLSLGDWGAFEIARVIGVFLAPLGAVMGWL